MTDALARLSALLSRQLDAAERPFTACVEMDRELGRLQALLGMLGSQIEPVDLQQAAVRQFWKSQDLESPREGRLVCFGVTLPHIPGGPCILEDSFRFATLLGIVDRWVQEPRRYRRCYQGLVANYFIYDANDPTTPAAGKENWSSLRQYLSDRADKIVGVGVQPEWVNCVVDGPHLFGVDPCEPYAAPVLRGETAGVDRVRAAFGINDSSWFVRELVMAQIAVAVRYTDQSFGEIVPRLLALLSDKFVLRDGGLALLLDRYSKSASTPLQQQLRDCAVQWWGNPWLTSNSMRWGGVTSSARAMVTEWLKLEFIDAFFTLLADEGAGERRRLDFWKRYVKAIDEIHFALGADASTNATKDFVDLRRKMKGLTVPLRGSVSNNAFVMRMGDLIVVEFSGRANALYGYDRKRGVPFSLDEPLGSAKDGQNSLKSSAHYLRWSHFDGVKGYGKWEQMFESNLKRHFGIEPAAAIESPPRAVHRRPGTPDLFSVPYSRPQLEAFAKEHRLVVADRTVIGGSLWVLSASWNAAIDRVLAPWGFKFKAGKGWWK